MRTAFAAGFFDGEGSVYIGKNRHSRMRCEFIDTLKVQFSQTSPRTLRELAKRWGGAVGGPYNRGGVKKPVWSWSLCGTKAEQFLRDIRPYVIEKAAQVWLALEYRAQCFTDHACRGHPRTEEDLALREGFRLALQSAKQVVEQ